MHAVTRLILSPPVYLLASLVGAVVTLGIAINTLMAEGHAAFNTTSMGVVWGLPIVTYDYFLLTSTGLVMVACLGLVFGIERFNLIAKRCLWLAVAGLIGGVAVLMLELGYPIRALWMTPINFQVLSPLFWKVLLVAAYTVVLLLLFYRIDQGAGREAARPLAIAGFALAVAIALAAGSVFALMTMRPFWFGGEVMVVFLIESFLGGLAFVLFFTYLARGFDPAALPEDLRAFFAGGFGMFFAAVIGLHAALVGGRAIAGAWSTAEGLQVWGHMLASPLFWGGTLLGILVPLVLMATPDLRRRAWAQMLAAVLVMIGLFIARYEFIIGGQMVPLFKGSWAPGLLDYVPSATEWLLLLGGIFLANVVNAAGAWLLDLDARPAEAPAEAAARPVEA
jgi:Ni/Fe-hydrogenase subunit HybB-like protein